MGSAWSRTVSVGRQRFRLQDYNWVSGRATSVAIDPADSTGNTVFVGGAFGGIWKSTNAGPLSANPASVTWTPLIDDQATLAVGAIAIQPGNSNVANSVVLVGTGEANSSADSYYGIGILRSTNGGTSWSTITQSADSSPRRFAGMAVSKIAYSTTNPSLAVAAFAGSALGDILGLENPITLNRGLYYSQDGGATWHYATVTDNGVTVAPGSATSVIYNAGAGLFFAALRFHGIYSSSDGIHWSRLAVQPIAGLSLTACPTNPSSSACPIYRGEFSAVPGRNEMYLWFVDSGENDMGIWRTTNGGTSWTQIPDTTITSCGDSFGCGTTQGTYNLELNAVVNGSATDLYAGAINLYKCTLNTTTSTTCSQGSWLNLTHVYGCSSIAKVHPDQHDVDAIVSNGKAILYFANDGGIYRALDGYLGLTTNSCSGTNQFDSLNQTLGLDDPVCLVLATPNRSQHASWRHAGQRLSSHGFVPRQQHLVECECWRRRFQRNQSCQYDRMVHRQYRCHHPALHIGYFVPRADVPLCCAIRRSRRRPR